MGECLFSTSGRKHDITDSDKLVSYSPTVRQGHKVVAGIPPHHPPTFADQLRARKVSGSAKVENLVAAIRPVFIS